MTKILQSLDTLSGVMTSPSATFSLIRDRRPAILALFTAVSLALASGLVLVPNPPRLVEVILIIPQGTLSLWTMLPVWVVLFLTILTIQAAFLHVVAAILKGKGSYLSMHCMLCFAYTPGLLIAPLAALRAILSSEVGNTVYQVSFALLCIWIFLLGINAIRLNYQLNFAKAVTLGTVALTVLVVLPAIIAVVVMTNLLS